MQQTIFLLPVVIPALFWAGYHYHKDRHLPEPPFNLLLCFGLGLVAALISKGLYRGLEVFDLRYDAVALAADNPVGLFGFALLGIGPIEELAKLLPFLAVVIHLKAFDEPLDGIIYASFIGLGYAAYENVMYLDFLTPLESLARGFASPVVHILFASIWGYIVSRAVLAKRSVLKSALKGFVIASLLHGIYDFLVLLHPVSALPVAAGLIVVLWIWRLLLMRNMHRHALTLPTSVEDAQPRL